MLCNLVDHLDVFETWIRSLFCFVAHVHDRSIVLVTSRTEVATCCEAHELLTSEGVHMRVISVPFWEVLDEQSEDYIMTVMGRPHLKHASKSAQLSAPPRFS